MAFILTDNEIKDLLNTSVWIDSKIANIHTDYLMKSFNRIDNKYSGVNNKGRAKNKGRKGELLLCSIIDITLNRFNFGLRQDYSVIAGYGANQKTKQGGVDYRIDLNGKILLVEAKNLSTTKIDQHC